MNHPWIHFFPSFIRNKLEGRLTIQKALSNTGWLIADKILRKCVGLFVGVWVARYLAPEQFGLYNYAIAFVALFSPLASLGLDNIAIRNIVNSPDSADEILGTAFALKLIGGITAFVFATVTIKFIRPNDSLTHLLVLIIAVSFVFWTFSTIDFWFRSQVQSKYTVYATSTAFMLTSIGKVGLILIQAPVIAFAAVYLAEIVFSAIGWVLVYQLNDRKISRFAVSFRQAKNLMEDSWPLILSGFMTLIYMRIDQIMLGNMLGNISVGIYSAAVRLSELWYFIPMAIVSSVFPSIIELKKTDETVYMHRLQMLYNVMTWIVVPIAVFVTFFSHYIIDYLYGLNYDDAGTVLAIHIWSGIFVFWGVASSQFLLTENYTRVVFFRTLFGALANVGLNLLLIPKYQVIGATVTTLISYFLSVFCVVFFKKTRQQAVMMVRSLFSMPTFTRNL